MKYKVKLGIHKALDSLLRKLCSKFSLSCVKPLWLISGRSLGMVGGDFQWIYDHHQCITYNMAWSETPKIWVQHFLCRKMPSEKSLSTHPLCHFQTHINSRYQLSSRLSSASWIPQKSGNLGWRYGDTMGKNADPEVSWKKCPFKKRLSASGLEMKEIRDSLVD